jgi:ABC-2 type transport system ATP-binding protein
MEKVFKAQKLTKVFKNGGGVRGLNFEIYKGETIGIIGINGAGKTTLMRLLMGFYTPNRGSVTINGLDPFKDAAILKEKIAYIPGEIGFPQLRNGEDFLKTQQAFLEATNLDKAHEIAGKFNLFTKAKLKTMSKGMKQKTAIVSAFIRDKDILIFDEPSTGLDPLMRDTFIELIQEQKKLGKTIIFSTHIFLEAERCCDYIYFIDDGKI